MKLLSEIKLKPGYSQNDILQSIHKRYKIKQSEIENFEIIKESIDSRKKPEIFIILNIAAKLKDEKNSKYKNLKNIEVDHSGLFYPKIQTNHARPVVVGFGPSGMFAGLALAKAGFCPIILEQGKPVDERQKDVDQFWNDGKLNKFSNVQFGEGGAGTFSDGKLASNVSNSYTKKVINEFILHGAPQEIFYSGTPHIGSDKLKDVVVSIRNEIIKYGGEIVFNAHFDDVLINNNAIEKIFYTNLQNGKRCEIISNALILAVGHSAVDVYSLLKQKECKMSPKPFAMGVRIEQKQADINLAQYGLISEKLPPANYKLVEHLENGRSVFTFCMCPGGMVVASSSEENTIVTNGMSNYKRDGENANAAVLVNVTPDDYVSDDVLSGVEFQHRYEQLAFKLGGGNYHAPAESVKSFLNDDLQYSKNCIKSTYLPNIKIADLRECLPDFVVESLKLALPRFDKRINGFAKDENLLIGVETRSSAPVQITRDENFMTSINGLFACGEGAGYAGGITSSAQDGIKCAEKVMQFLTE